MDNIIEQMAADVVARMKKRNASIPNAVCLDPLTMIAIGGFILNCIELFMKCGESENDAVVRMNNPSGMDALRMRRVVKKGYRKMPNGPDGKPVDTLKDVQEAMLETGKTTTITQVKGMYAQVRAKQAAQVARGECSTVEDVDNGDE